MKKSIVKKIQKAVEKEGYSIHEIIEITFPEDSFEVAVSKEGDNNLYKGIVTNFKLKRVESY